MSLAAGRWSDLGPQQSNVNSKRVFKLFVDHAKSPRGASYHYVVVPGVTADQIAKRVSQKHYDDQVLSNERNLQVLYRGTVLAAAFWKAGKLDFYGQTIEVDRPCLLMLAWAPGAIGGAACDCTLSVSNPENETAVVIIKTSLELHGGDEVTPLPDGITQVCVELPGGLAAGSTVSLKLHDETPHWPPD